MTTMRSFITGLCMALLLGSGVAHAVVVTSWTFVDGNGANGINKDVTKSASSPQYTVFQKKLYSVWRETNQSGKRQIRVAVYNGVDSGPLWTFVDGNGADGINKDVTEDASDPQMIVFNRKLYVTWVEQGTSADQVRVAVYNGLDLTPAWTFVDGNGADGLNKDTTRNASQPQLAVAKRKLYLTWREPNGLIEQIRVAVYNGLDATPAWSFVDGNGANGINKDVAEDAFDPQIISYHNKLYAIWGETTSGSDQIRMAVYNGDDLAPAWTFVDGNGVNGINKDTGRNAWSPQLAILRGKLYATWIENNGPKDQVRVVRYNGLDLTPAWTFVDGNGASGLNKDTGENADKPQLTVHGNMLYATWQEWNGTADQIRMVVFNGSILAPAWSFVDGNGVNGINKDSTKDAAAPQIVSFNRKLYAIWRESNGTVNQIRTAVGQ